MYMYNISELPQNHDMFETNGYELQCFWGLVNNRFQQFRSQHIVSVLIFVSSYTEMIKNA